MGDTRSPRQPSFPFQSVIWGWERADPPLPSSLDRPASWRASDLLFLCAGRQYSEPPESRGSAANSGAEGPTHDLANGLAVRSTL